MANLDATRGDLLGYLSQHLQQRQAFHRHELRQLDTLAGMLPQLGAEELEAMLWLIMPGSHLLRHQPLMPDDTANYFKASVGAN